MKIKCQPEDFRVEELTSIVSAGGPFALYRLTKQSLDTPQAVQAIARRWRLRPSDISYGGMKDRHALTQQHLTIRRGPRRGLKQTNLELAYIGQVEQPFRSFQIAGNRFALVLRDMSGDAAAAADTAMAQVAEHGLPNYFDEQRFGSVGQSGDFVARHWCLGDYERALWLALADANDHDRPRARQARTVLRERWGQWPAVMAAAPDAVFSRIVAHLAERPQDFRNAFAMLPADLRDLYLSAFQSHLWNRMLSRLIVQSCPAGDVFRARVGPDSLAFFRTLTDVAAPALRDRNLPLPSARVKLQPGPDLTLLAETLAELGMELGQLKLKPPRDVFFIKGERAAWVLPRGLRWAAEDDELYQGRRKLMLSFDLPRGAYATILVKRISGHHVVTE
jgi:tRNA pseudouridine13 synthase